MLSNVFANWGWTRDDLKWPLAIVGAIIVGLAAAFVDEQTAAYYGFPAVWLPRLRGAALVVGIVAATMKTSGLPPKALAWLLLGVLGSAVGCASLPVKQRAVNSLQASELALEAAWDAERAICSPAATPTTPLTQCDGAVAAAVGLTFAQHQAIDRQFSTAFGGIDTAQTALKAWRAGDPVPTTLLNYQTALHDVLTAVAAILPKTAAPVTKVQQAIDEAAQIAALIGVQ